MNQLYRALHMPPGRLLRKLCGEKEIYTVAVRRAPAAEGAAPLPALGGAPYTPLPAVPGKWYADPLLYRRGAQRFLFCEEFDMAAAHGDIAVCELDENGAFGPMQTVLHEEYHLSFPYVFDWNGETWMIPESGANHSLNLYRCTDFPAGWERAAQFDVGRELCDTIVLRQTPGTLALLCSETRPENQLYVRWRRYDLRRDEAAPQGFAIAEDEPFNLNHRDFDLTSRNAGPLFEREGQTVHPTQVSTTVDYGAYLQFIAHRADAEVPLCAATPENVRIAGLDPKDVVGIHTYCRDDALEIIDARYLTRVKG